MPRKRARNEYRAGSSTETLHANTDHHRRRVGDPRSCRDLGPGDQGASFGSDQARPAAAAPKLDAKTAADAKIAGMIGDTRVDVEGKMHATPKVLEGRKNAVISSRPAGADRAAATRPTW